jgi:hypothetical protein
MTEYEEPMAKLSKMATKVMTNPKNSVKKSGTSTFLALNESNEEEGL